VRFSVLDAVKELILVPQFLAFTLVGSLSSRENANNFGGM
jgi:hypothetical protein